MSVTQIVGPRVVPMWADPVEWTPTKTYDANTYVAHDGNSYASRQAVPIGIDIKNESYWVMMANFNAQAQSLQTTMRQTIETHEKEVTKQLKDNSTAVQKVVDDVNTQVNTIKGSVQQINTIETNLSSVYPKSEIVVIGDSWAANSTYTQWWKILEARFGFKVHCYAQGGYGYVSGGGFLSLINNGANDTSYNHTGIRLVIMEGGCNDYRVSTSPLSKMQDCIARSHNVWPNAPIMMVSNGWPFGKLDKATQLPAEQALANMQLTRNALKTLNVTNGIHAICQDWILQCAQSGFYEMSDTSPYKYHPLQAGQTYFATFIASHIIGGNAAFNGNNTLPAPTFTDNNKSIFDMSTNRVFQDTTGASLILNSPNLITGTYYSPYPTYGMTSGPQYNIGAVSTTSLIAVPKNEYSISVVNTKKTAEGATYCQLKFAAT